MDSRDPRPSLNELQERIRSLTEENVQLRDKNERLFTKLGYLESRLGNIAGSKTDLSSRLVQSEEEKLKISKELVEVQIQGNKMREQYEEETFELKNKILNQEGVAMELELERDKLRRELQSAAARLQLAEKGGADLAEEYVTLKRNFLALTEAHEREVAQNEELSAELLHMAQAQDALRRQLEERQREQQCVRGSTQRLHGEGAQELDRVQALVSRMSHSRVRPEDLAVMDQERKSMERSLLGNQDEIKDMLEKLKRSYEEQQSRLEEKVVAMGREQQENKRAIRSTQQKLWEQNAALLSSQSQKKEVEEENSKLQLQVKELNEEYRARLVRYLHDLAEYVDGLAEGAKGPPEKVKMRGFVDSMLREVRTSYRAREEQLASAARSYKKRLQAIARTHQALLIAYRVQREQILAQPESGLEPGPPEGHFSLEPAELSGEAERELQRLRQDKARLESQLRQAEQQVSLLAKPANVVSFKESGETGQVSEGAWADIRKQLREMTRSTQEAHERERVQLVTRATVAEEQVLELQEYVDLHLGRYKQEIRRLRSLLGLEEAGRAHSADAPKPRLLRRSLRNPSYEI